MNRNATTAVFVIALLIVGTAFFFSNRKRKQQDAPIAPITLPPISTTPDPVLEKIGLKRMFLARNRENAFIDVRTYVERQCAPGDLDAIKLEHERSKSPRYLLTLESLGAGDFAPQTKEVTFEDMQRGISHRFKVPVGRKYSLGLFLCRDVQKTGRCAGKIAVEFNKIFTRNILEDASTQGEPSDKVYFFQYVHVTQDEYLEAFNNPHPKQAAFDELKRYIGGDAGAQEIDTAMKNTVERSNTLRSNPVEFNNEVAISLPKYDVSRCPIQPKAQ